MSIESLLEDAIITDFKRDGTLASQTIRKHDYGGALAGDNLLTDPEATSVMVVTAIDRGEFKMGSGIRNLSVEVQIRVNGDADNFNGTLLDNLAEIVLFRLMSSPTVSGAISGREGAFSLNGLKVFGIINGDVTQRTESGLERIRTVPATFYASKVS